MKKASKHLGFDLEAAKTARRVGGADKDNRDLLIYLLWRTGRLSNVAVGTYFGLSYFAISQRVKIIKEKILVDKNMRRRYNGVKSIIKV